MTQSTILASGTDTGTSSDVTITAGSSVNVGIFVSSGALPASLQANVLMDTPGTGDVQIGTLTSANPAQTIVGPGTFRVQRIASRQAFGIYSEA